MKRLFQILMVIAVLVIIFFQYRSWQRHRAPEAYSYAVDSTIDWEYHNPELIRRYLFAAEEVGHYGRYAWSKHGVDVLTDSPTDPESSEMVRKYHSIIAETKYLEARLKQSSDMKLSGMSASDVNRLENGGTGSQQLLSMLMDNPVLARVSDRGALVYEIQKRLMELGIELPVDGIYRIETEAGVRKFQENEELYPSGQVDRLTLVRLFAKE